jgi:hypothetical protein
MVIKTACFNFFFQNKKCGKTEMEKEVGSNVGEQKASP